MSNSILHQNIKKYYQHHSVIYDISRWSFLFGRNSLLDNIPPLPQQPRILDIGCGTGKNMKLLSQKYPNAHITGIDLSEHMLQVAHKKLGKKDNLQFVHAAYGSEDLNFEPFDLIHCSYSVTLINNSYEQLLTRISSDLKHNGYLAVVDFHTSPFGWFRHWMNLNHVNFSGSLLPALHQQFTVRCSKQKRAYGGWWSYFNFVGTLD